MYKNTSSDPMDRPLYAVSPTTALPETTEVYAYALVSSNFGMVNAKSNDGETYTITLNSDQKQVMILVLNGATFIDSIKVYLKK